MRALAPFALTVTLCACSSSTSSSGTQSGSDGGPQGDAAAACSSLQLGAGTIIPLLRAPPPAPTPRGGTIPDGTYEVSRYTFYSTGTIPGKSQRGTLRFTGNEVEWSSLPDGSAGFVRKYTYSISGSSLALQCVCTQKGPECGPSDSKSITFSVTGSDISLYDSVQVEVTQYTRQL